MANLSFNISGLPLGLLETPVSRTDEEIKAGVPERTYHCFRLETVRGEYYGVAQPAFADELPDFVVIDGITLPLTRGLTAATYTEKVAVKDEHGQFVLNAKGRKTYTKGLTVTVPEDERRPKVSHESEQEFPSIGEMREVKIGITVTDNGTWNIKVSVHRKRSVSPEQRKARAVTRAQANFDAIAALFANV